MVLGIVGASHRNTVGTFPGPRLTTTEEYREVNLVYVARFYEIA